VNVINGGANNGVFWQVGSSATLGTDTDFAGNIIALASITLTTGADILCGRAIALTAAVTLDSNVLSDNCGGGSVLGSDKKTSVTGNSGTGRADFGSSGFSGPAGDQAGVIPEPATLALMGLGFAGLVSSRRKKS
jgi:type VI secretion system secreted protein VgrG